MDGRRERSTESRKAIEAAIHRLKSGAGKHPRHAGLSIHITKSAICLEAGIGRDTLYRSMDRFPDLAESVEAAIGERRDQRPSRSEQHRKHLVDTVELLRRQNEALIAENLRLTRELGKYDPTLGVKAPIDLSSRRQDRKVRK